MKKHYDLYYSGKILSAGVFILFFNSCSILVSDEFPAFDPVPNVNAILVAGDTIRVHVSLVEKIDSSDLTNVTNAEIVIRSNQDIDTLEHTEDGIYISDLIAEHNCKYLLEARIDGFERLETTDSIPDYERARIFDHSNHYVYNDQGEFMAAVGIEFKDNPNTIDYYEIAILERIEGEGISYVRPYNENSPLLLNEGFEPYVNSTVLLSDELFEDTIVRMYLDFPQATHISNYGDSLVQHFEEHTVYFELRHVSKEYYLYIKHYFLYERNREPFFIDGTSSTFQLYSNVNGGFGVFAGFAATIDSVWIPEEYYRLDYENK